MTAYVGHGTKVAIDPETAFGDRVFGDFDANSLYFITESFQPSATSTLLPRDGMRGDGGMFDTDTRLGVKPVRLSLGLQPSPQELTDWMVYILGAGGAMADTLGSFGLLADMGADRKVYSGCKVNSATFRCTQGGLMSLDLDIVAKDETPSASAFPSATYTTQGPLAFSDTTFTYGGTGYDLSDFTLTVNRNLVADRFLSNRTITDLPVGSRNVSLTTVHPYDSDIVGIHNTTEANCLAGLTTTLVLTDAVALIGVTFSFTKLQYQKESPVVAGRDQENVLTCNFVAKKTTSTQELVVTVDETSGA